MRIFLGVTEIAGYYRGLKKGFDTLGARCDLEVLYDQPFAYGPAGGSPPTRLTRGLIQTWSHNYRLSLALRLPGLLVEKLLTLPLFVWAVVTHDVFIFGFGKSFFWLYDLPVLRFFGKKIIFIFHGSDARPPYMDGFIMRSSRGVSISACIGLTKKVARTVRRIERWSDRCIVLPTLNHFFRKPTVNFNSVGIPSAPQTYDLINSVERDDESVRILHSPSNPEAKGSAEIKRAVDAVRQKAYPIEYREITGRPHEDVLRELAQSDVVVDQLYTDMPIAGFGTESAWFGKPCVIGGYCASFWKQLSEKEPIAPTVFCLPEEAQDAIERLVADAAERRRIGERAKEFVRTHWLPEHVAANVLRVIRGDIPPVWVHDPMNLRYVEGMGQSKERTRAIIRRVVEQEGAEALCVEHNPELKAVLLSFAYEHSTTEDEHAHQRTSG